jgi:hypothetical protein
MTSLGFRKTISYANVENSFGHKANPLSIIALSDEKDDDTIRTKGKRQHIAKRLIKPYPIRRTIIVEESTFRLNVFSINTSLL